MAPLYKAPFKILPAVLLVLYLLLLSACRKESGQPIQLDFQPNILWLSVEDIGCYLPMYGDSTIQTPHLDRLAEEGMVFGNAFTAAGVCAPSRFSIISAMHPACAAAVSMRTQGRKFQDTVKYIPEYLMEAGYYCTNNSKTDYNFTIPEHESLWHESSKDAHYKNRPGGKPFFAVFNFTGTHEARFFKYTDSQIIDPDKVRVPPYYPDTKTVRRDLARRYYIIQRMDSWVGEMLSELEERNLLDSTVIFFWSDHGGPLPNEKREIYDRGTKVPLIVRVPGKWRSGERVADMVSLMDLGPTILSLAGIKAPSYMHGKAFLGEYKAKPREYVHAARDRITNQFNMRRTTRDKRYRYVRHFFPETPKYHEFGFRMNIALMQELRQLLVQDALDAKQKSWFEPVKPVEEFYDTQMDPFERNNLIDDPDYANEIQRLRKANRNWMMEIKDVGFIPKPMVYRLQDSLGMPIYSIVRKYHYPMEKIHDVATAWTENDVDVDRLAGYLSDTLPVIRYWAAVGLGNLGERSASHIPGIKQLLQDKFPSIRIAAAFALYQLGEKELALERLNREAKGRGLSKRLASYQLYRIDLMKNPVDFW